jgi:undecaprenyl-diphosphatase
MPFRDARGAAVTCGFVRIAEELGEGELANLDEWLLPLLRVPGHPHIPIGPAWLIEAAQDIHGPRRPHHAVTVFAIGYLALEGKHGAMWLAATAAGGGGLLSTVMKQLFGRDRPDVVPHLVAVTSSSFPSGHSMLAAIVYLTLGALLARFAARRRTRVYMLTVALFVTLVAGLTVSVSCWLQAKSATSKFSMTCKVFADHCRFILAAT